MRQSEGVDYEGFLLRALRTGADCQADPNGLNVG